MQMSKENFKNLSDKKSSKSKYRLTQLLRQLLLYEIFCFCEEVSYEEIRCRIPMNQRTIQRDIADLTEAGLLSVYYSRSRQAYVDKENPLVEVDASKVSQRKKAHHEKLRRLSWLMRNLQHDKVSEYEKFDRSKYKSCKDYYFEEFPEATIHMMQHDFKELNRLSYWIKYVPQIDFYVMWDDVGCLREDFGIVEEDGTLYLYSSDEMEVESLWNGWEELVEYDEDLDRDIW